MKAKAYLSQIRKYDTLIENKTQMIQRLREQATSVTAAVGGERVMSSGNPDRMADTIVKIVDLGDLIRGEVKRLVEAKEEIMHTIDEVDETDLMDVLYKRYVLCLHWEDIPDEMNVSPQTVYRLHGKALLKVQAILDERLRVNESK